MNANFLIKQCAAFGILFSVSIVGDFVLYSKTVQSNIYLRCVTDNFTHLCLGISSWLIVASYEKFSVRLVYQSLVCGIFASLIDVDHFLMAKSLSLKKATDLPSRPLLHNTTLMVTLTSCFIFVTHCKGHQQLEDIGWYILVASVSHHLRDALHRGLWLWPWAAKPMHFNYYLLLSYLFPLAVGSLLKIMHHGVPREKVDVVHA